VCMLKLSFIASIIFLKKDFQMSFKERNSYLILYLKPQDYESIFGESMRKIQDQTDLQKNS